MIPLFDLHVLSGVSGNTRAGLRTGVTYWLVLWSSVSQAAASTGLPAGVVLPDFPLIPASRGFCLTLARALEAFKAALPLEQ